MTFLTVVIFLAGLVLLVAGAETLVRGATRLGLLAGLSPMVVGLTIVSFATTAPEASVSVVAASQGLGGLALGNVLGSNIFNILVVAGAAAVISRVTVDIHTVRFDLPILIGATLAVFWFASDGRVSAIEGVLLLLGLAAFVSFTVTKSRSGSISIEQIEHMDDTSLLDGGHVSPVRAWGLGVLGVAVGAVLLVFGSRFFVDSASTMAAAIGVSDLVIGLTVVAVGTSAPELTTATVAAFRGETDVAIGNAIGASVINLLGIIGLSSLVGSGGLPVPDVALKFDFPVALIVVLGAIPITMTGSYQVGRVKGLLMLATYLLYVSSLLYAAFNMEAVDTMSDAVVFVILPMVGLVTVGVLVRAWRHGKRALQ